MNDLLLLIESSGPLAHVGLAVRRGGDWVAVAEAPEIGSAEASDQPPMQHTALLLPLMRQVLAKAPPLAAEGYDTLTPDGHLDLRRTAFARLSAVAVSSGPGSYTALRAGLSSAKGLCLALGIPLLKCDTLRGLAMEAQAIDEPTGSASQGRVAALLFARRDEVYYGVYEADGRVAVAPGVAKLTAEWVSSLMALGVTTVCGPDEGVLESFCESLTDGLRGQVTARTTPLSGANLLSECRLRIANSDYDDLAAVTPDYLRAPHITQPRTRG